MISLLAVRCVPAQSTAPTPAIALLDPADAAQWQTWTKDLGWKVIAPASTENNIDLRVQALEKAVQEAIRGSGADPARIYLAGRGEAAAAVFYAISRVPDLWAAAVAVGGTPQNAVDSGRLFAANFGRVPVLWVSGGAADQDYARQLKSAGIEVEWRPTAGATTATMFDWLAKHRREAFPEEIDCETTSPAFARCYWIQLTKFDVNERNDVLPSSRVQPGSGAALDLGAFGYRTDDSGPGVLVSFLPDKYDGPLKLDDRIVAIDGRPLENARAYVEMMARYTEEKAAAVTVERGKERIRIETRVVLPRRELLATARVQAKYESDNNDFQIISRTVKEMRVTVPPGWAQGGRLYWNGLVLEKIDKPGCLLLSVEKGILHSASCED